MIEIIENFFVEDNFFETIEDYFEYHGMEEDCSLLEDDWELEIEYSKLEPVFNNISPEYLCQLLADNNEDRLSDHYEEEENVLKALTESIDYNKLYNLLPKYYYPTGKYFTITKDYLIDYFKI